MRRYTITRHLDTAYEIDFSKRLLRVGVRPDRVWLLEWDERVDPELMEADEQRLPRILSCLFQFATAVSQHTHVLTQEHYGNHREAPHFRVNLCCEHTIPKEMFELIEHFNAVSSVGRIDVQWQGAAKKEDLPSPPRPAALVAGGKDTAWMLRECQKTREDVLGLFVRGTSINGEFLDEETSAERLADTYAVDLRRMSLWHVDMEWRSLIMRHRTIWRDLVLVALARMLGGPVYTGINDDRELAQTESALLNGHAKPADHKQVAFNFHNSVKAIAIMEAMLDTRIHRAPDEFEIYVDLVRSGRGLLELSDSCQDPLRRCQPENERRFHQSCSKCKTLAVYARLARGEVLGGKWLEFALSNDFSGSMEVQQMVRNSADPNDPRLRVSDQSLWDVALSYSSSDTAYARALTCVLRALGLRVYDYQEEDEYSRGKKKSDVTWEVYRKRSRSVVVLWSKYHGASSFLGMERYTILERVEPGAEHQESVLVVNLDGTEIDNPLSTLFTMYAEEEAASDIVKSIAEFAGFSFPRDAYEAAIEVMPPADPVYALFDESMADSFLPFTRADMIWALLLRNPDEPGRCYEAIANWPSPLLAASLIERVSHCDDTSDKGRLRDLAEYAVETAFRHFCDGLVEIPAGDCMLGFPAEWLSKHLYQVPENHRSMFSRTVERVSLPEFWIDRFPITRRAMLQLGIRPPSHFPQAPALDEMDLSPFAPGTGVSLEKARDIARRIGRRIPTAEEWEKAARGGLFLDREMREENRYATRLYPWDPSGQSGIEFLLSRANLSDDMARKPILESVHAHPGGASPYGVMDLCGNAWEWTDTVLDGTGIVKGGSWFAVEDFPYLNRWGGMVCANGPNAVNRMFPENLGFRTASDAKPTLDGFRVIVESHSGAAREWRENAGTSKLDSRQEH